MTILQHHAQKPKQKRNLTLWLLNNNKLTMPEGPGSAFGIHG